MSAFCKVVYVDRGLGHSLENRTCMHGTGPGGDLQRMGESPVPPPVPPPSRGELALPGAWPGAYNS